MADRDGAHAPASSAAEPAEDAFLEGGTPAYRRANLAMFVGGFSTFALLYATQPLLPLLSADFGVGAASASVTVSAGTAALALMLIPASILSDRVGREAVMKAALALAAVLSLLSPIVQDFDQLVVLRALLGAVLAGLPAVAMAYLGEEVAPNAQSRAMGLYIAGNALGGMSGRVLAALFADWGNWRLALAVLGAGGVVAAIVFWRSLPPSRHFSPRAARIARIWQDGRAIAADSGLRWLFLTAFLIMGAFVGLYNYLGFRLMDAPFGLGQTAIGAIFLLYLVGTAASAWSGQLADRHGRRNMLWIMATITACGLALTLASHLPTIIAGVGVFTFGFFATHSLASGWVARRGRERRALAAALYLCSYYLGASLVGTLAGIVWDEVRWRGVAAILGLCVLAAVAVALRLRRIEPLPATEARADSQDLT